MPAMVLLLILFWSPPAVAQTEDDTLTRTELSTLANVIRHAGYTLAEAGITVPFPQRDLHVRLPDALLGKEGKS